MLCQPVLYALGRAWGERGGENGSDRVSSSWLPPTSFLGRFALLVRDHDHRADPSFTPLLLPLLLLLSPSPVELLTEWNYCGHNAASCNQCVPRWRRRCASRSASPAVHSIRSRSVVHFAQQSLHNMQPLSLLLCHVGCMDESDGCDVTPLQHSLPGPSLCQLAGLVCE